jgi:hypothetical protein
VTLAPIAARVLLARRGAPARAPCRDRTSSTDPPVLASWRALRSRFRLQSISTKRCAQERRFEARGEHVAAWNGCGTGAPKRPGQGRRFEPPGERSRAWPGCGTVPVKHLDQAAPQWIARCCQGKRFAPRWRKPRNHSAFPARHGVAREARATAGAPISREILGSIRPRFSPVRGKPRNHSAFQRAPRLTAHVVIIQLSSVARGNGLRHGGEKPATIQLSPRLTARRRSSSRLPGRVGCSARARAPRP